MMGDMSVNQLAGLSGCDERYVKEWCLHMAATKILNVKNVNGKEVFYLPDRVKESIKNPS